MDMYQAERTLANGETTVSMAKSSPKEAWMDAEYRISNKQSVPSPNKPQQKQGDDLTIKNNAGFKP